ncbi:arsenate reductase/protein-tyrosine-phosphatase family protein [Microbacterium sp. NPDC055312]
MSDSESSKRPGLRRADLRRLREALTRGQADVPGTVSPAPAPARTVPPAAAARPTPPVAPGGDGGTIMTVCTGNICRSPMAEVLLRSALADLGVRVHSAGTHALVDEGMTEQALQLAIGHGADATASGDHRARLLTGPLLTETDLVLTMAREHRSHVVQMMPALLHRTFTLREFARLAVALTDDEVREGVASAGPAAGARLQALARLIGSQRGLVPAEPDNDDVIDPYRRSQKTYDLSASQLVPAVNEAARVIRAALSPGR